MSLHLDAQGINIYLKIKGYKPSDSDTWDSQWCNCDFSFYSGTWLNYRKEDDEVLLSCEVEELADKFSRLLNDELSEPTEILCIEPDFIFTLFPKRDLREDPRYTYVQPGHEIADIYVEWKIFFWNQGLTDNFLTITLGREDILQFKDYLYTIIE